MTLKVSFEPFFSIDNFSKDNFEIPSTTRQLFIVWRLWNFLDTWKTTRILRCFCTPERMGNLECWKLSHHKISLQGTISHPTLRKPENHLHNMPLEKGYVTSQEGIPYFSSFSCSSQIRINVHYTLINWHSNEQQQKPFNKNINSNQK